MMKPQLKLNKSGIALCALLILVGGMLPACSGDATGAAEPGQDEHADHAEGEHPEAGQHAASAASSGHEDHDQHDGHESEDAHAQPGGHESHAGHEGHAEGERAVELTPAELKEFDIELADAAGGELAMTLALPGEVVVNPDHVVHVVPRASGVAEKVNRTIGDRVEAGDLLAVLDSAELADAKSQYLAQRKAAELARIDRDRQQTLHDNTRKMLDLLRGSPPIEALDQLEDLDVGANRGELLGDYAEYVTARADHERQKNLHEQEIASEAKMLEAQRRYKKAWAAYLSTRDDLAFRNRRTLAERKRAYEVAQSDLNTAERRLHTLGLTDEDARGISEQDDAQLSRLEIRSPIDGVITDRHIARGEKLVARSEAFVLADLSRVWVELTVYQKNLADVQPGQRVTVRFGHGIPDATGRIEYVSPIVGHKTRTATARVVLDNEDGRYRPGLFVDATVRADTVDAAVRVPRSALQTLHDETVIFVKGEHGFEPRHVTLGRTNETHVEITAGLEPGETYVAAGSFTLKAELMKGSFQGHSH